MDLPADLGDDPLHRREPEPGPLRARTVCARREERLEHSRLNLGAHAVPVSETTSATHSPDRVPHRSSVVVPHDISRRKPDATAFGYRIARVQHEVHRDLTDLTLVREDGADRRSATVRARLSTP